MNDSSREQPSPFDQDYASEQLRRSQQSARRLIKRFYLRNMRRYLTGPTIDFGCGAGQLLAQLPMGSVGIETNPTLVRHLERQGFEVQRARGDFQDFDLAHLPPGRFRSLVIAHVLEHLDDPWRALVSLLRASNQLGITRVLAIVPGRKGFQSDATHRTFVDRDWLAANPVPADVGFRMTGVRYFPGPRWLGRWFAYHEMLVTFDRAAGRGI